MRRALHIVLWIGLVACGGAPRGADDGPARGRRVDFPVELLDGGTVRLRDYEGRAVVLHFFATWSLAAQVDVEEMERVRRRFGPRVEVLGMAMDLDGARLVEPWRDALAVEYDLALADESLVRGASPLGPVTVTPTTFVLDPAGRLAWRHEGGLSPGKLEEVVASLVDGGRAP